MEWIQRFNQAIDYIEQNITQPVDYQQIAQVACCSAYHFQRMFACLADLPLSEYIRRRRMSRAAADLQGGQTVLEVALKYGYASPTAFNRAFQGVHGIPPSRAKEQGAPLKTYPPIRFTITVKGAQEMNYRIEEKPAFRIVGAAWPLHQELEKNFAMVPGLWQQAATDGTIPQLAGMMEGPPMGLLGVSTCNSQQTAGRYFIAVASSQPAAGKLQEYTVPACTWAIFEGSGTGQSIQQLEQRVVTDWLPTSGYEYADAPDIEVYLSPDPANAKYEVWLPVKKV